MNHYVWKCSCCDFVYDELIGQHEKGILPGTTWERVPENWRCAVCGTDRSKFAPLPLDEYLLMCFGADMQELVPD
ncbi:Rubredoxin [Methylobacillus rhizosphaerae]|uniref:Rubredoxin n=1 Tax=Methylobacillus rhizosphaerae TaxID=551994 RepID=A0A238ZS71_9PROT|nr:rubredoxin [Methylobacillus rhizosphaerae]SNR86286.1 Rubredoxin [Methylobacillus rhizosphaerae]